MRSIDKLPVFIDGNAILAKSTEVFPRGFCRGEELRLRAPFLLFRYSPGCAPLGREKFIGLLARVELGRSASFVRMEFLRARSKRPAVLPSAEDFIRGMSDPEHRAGSSRPDFV